ncbi:TPA: hypothetical protein ACH3X1_002666 [Trebouxia sp. C0004]
MGHVRIEETSFSYNELAFVTLEVLKFLNDDVAKSGVHANQIHSENKATCSSLSAEYDQIFGQTENEPKLDWQQLSVKLDVAQSQLLQVQTDLNA